MYDISTCGHFAHFVIELLLFVRQIKYDNNHWLILLMSKQYPEDIIVSGTNCSSKGKKNSTTVEA